MQKKMKIKVKFNYAIIFKKTTLQRMQGSGVTYASFPSLETICNILEAAKYRILS